MTRRWPKEMRVKIVFPLILFAFFVVDGARAQTAPDKPVVSEATKPDPAKTAFLAFPEADRKAAQTALVWLGFYNGVTDGAFGKRTLESITAYQKKAGAKPDGVLTAALLAEMNDAAEKLRSASGFASFDDSASGIRISAPLKALEKRMVDKAHSRLASKDGAITLDLYALANEETLDSLFHRLATETADRKVAYKAMKLDAFFVVSGEEGGAKFYLRYANGPNGALRGFEFRYPKARAETLDRVALAVANSFEPFPTAPSAPVASSTPTTSPAGPSLIATAFVIAPGQALTALAPAQCASPLVGGAPARFGRIDESSNLARLDGDFGAGAAPARLGQESSGAILLSRAPGGAPDKSILEASRGDWISANGRANLVISAAATARGAPVFNGRGELLGLLAASAGPQRKIGGVTIAAPRDVIAGSALRAFVGEAGPAPGAAMTAPEISHEFGARTLAVTCAP